MFQAKSKCFVRIVESLLNAGVPSFWGSISRDPKLKRMFGSGCIRECHVDRQSVSEQQMLQRKYHRSMAEIVMVAILGASSAIEAPEAVNLMDGNQEQLQNQER
jgi:hypothetical protein